MRAAGWLAKYNIPEHLITNVWVVWQNKRRHRSRRHNPRSPNKREVTRMLQRLGHTEPVLEVVSVDEALQEYVLEPVAELEAA